MNARVEMAAAKLSTNPRWCWGNGMRVLLCPGGDARPAGRIVHASKHGIQLVEWERGPPQRRSWSADAARWRLVPDLDDDATAGKVLGMAIADSRALPMRCIGLTVEMGVRDQVDNFYNQSGAFGPFDSLGESAAAALLWWWSRLDEVAADLARVEPKS